MQLDTRLKPHLKCADCPIRHRAVCSRCNPGELAQLDAIKTYTTYRSGETIAWAGEPLAFLGSVVQGHALLSRTLPDGRRQMVGLLLPSDFVGRPGRTTSPYDVVAATAVTLCKFRRKAFEKLVAEIPSLESRLLEMTLDELDAAREWMLLLGRKTAREKIASLLLIMSQHSAALKRQIPGDGLQFDLPLTREAMADYLGLTIETVSRQISALRRDGIIELQGARRISVPDFGALLGEAGDDADPGVLI